MNCTIIGIDPGQAGGIAFIDAECKVWAHKMPETDGDIVDLFSEVKGRTFCFIEKVHSMPGQGVASTFKFGRGFGFLVGVIMSHGLPFEYVTPQAWQKSLGCLSGGDKNITKSKAQGLFPELKITHALADALLIAEYGRRLMLAR